MTAEKRDFKNFGDKKAFPGSIENSIYKFPTLFTKDKLGRMRKWDIFIRAVDKEGPRQNKIDWNIDAETTKQMSDAYFNTGDDFVEVDDDTAIQLWAENGITNGKITRNIPTYFTKGVLSDKANRRNAFQQALIEGRKQYLLRKNKGSTKSQREKGKSSNTNGMYFPMLAKKYDEAAKYLKYPLFIQPKLDGVRCITYLKKTDKLATVIMYSRTKKPFPKMEYLSSRLFKYLDDLYDKKSGSIYLDGELYRHGKRLQDISGESRNEKKPELNLNQYHIYDCFYADELDSPFEHRNRQLANIQECLSDEDKEFIRIVPTTEVFDEKDAFSKFDYYVNQGYEGIMLRNKDGKYLASASKTGDILRSRDLVKLKSKSTDEFEVVGFDQGKRGKDIGAIIWKVKTKTGKVFNVTPKDMTYDERKKYYKECIDDFDNLYKGKMLTVEYEILSKDGVPQRGKSLVFRDYE